MSIRDIRTSSTEPGLSKAEIGLIKLLELLSNGTKAKINVTGTQLKLIPGIIHNGDGLDLEFECPNERSISYYLECIIPICLFGKVPLTLTLRGVTNNEIDPSIDSIKEVLLPFLSKFGVEGAYLKINKRGLFDKSSGEVVLFLPNLKELQSVDFIDPGKVKRIRGVVYSCKTNPVLSNSIVSGLRNVFNDYIPDVWIHLDP